MSVPWCTVLFVSQFTEVHFVASPPALEESPGVWGASKRPSGLWVLSAGGKYRAAGSCRKAQGVERVLVSRTWGVGFLVFYQQGRGCLQNPLIQPHILFSSRRKENVPLTVQEKRAVSGDCDPPYPRETGECPADCPAHQTTLFPEHCRVSERTGYKKFRAVICFM